MNLIEKRNYISEGITYFNTAADGLLSKSNYEKLDIIRNEFRQNFVENRMNFILRDENEIRRLAARFVNCEPLEMCLTQSFSVGFNYLLPSLTQWKKVLLLENDYPSIWLPLGLREFEISYVKKQEDNIFSADRIISRAEEVKPQMIALSHVQYSTGYLIDIKRIGDYCLQNNIVFIVDGTQALGCIPIDLKSMNVDVYAASTYKWMCAGHGCGLMYINTALQQKIQFKTGGYMAWFTARENWKTQQSLAYLEPGHKDHEAFYRLKLALEDAQERDTSQVLLHNRDHILHLKESLKSKGIQVISDFSREETSGITVIKDPGRLFDRLIENKVYSTFREGNIRLSCHFYNDESDLKKLISMV